MKTCISVRTEIMWNTHKVGVTADSIVRYKASSLTVLQHSLTIALVLGLLLILWGGSFFDDYITYMIWSMKQSLGNKSTEWHP